MLADQIVKNFLCYALVSQRREVVAISYGNVDFAPNATKAVFEDGAGEGCGWVFVPFRQKVLAHFEKVAKYLSRNEVDGLSQVSVFNIRLEPSQNLYAAVRPVLIGYARFKLGGVYIIFPNYCA